LLPDNALQQERAALVRRSVPLLREAASLYRDAFAPPCGAVMLRREAVVLPREAVMLRREAVVLPRGEVSLPLTDAHPERCTLQESSAPQERREQGEARGLALLGVELRREHVVTLDRSRDRVGSVARRGGDE